MRTVVGAVVAVLLAGAASAAAADCTFTKVIDLPVTMRGRSPLADARVNGHDARFIVDSGAFFSVIGPSAATQYGMRIGPGPVGLGGVVGFGGRERTVRSTGADDFIFGRVDFHKVDFLVNEQDLGGGVAGLIGENFLHFADVEYDLGNGAVRLFTAKGCEQAALAYWAGSQPYSEIPIEPTTSAEPLIKAWAILNGHRVRVMFDTGAPVSVLTLSAAARVGVHPGDPGVTIAGVLSGVAQRSYLRTWLAPFSDFKIGDEEIKTFRLLIGETQTEDDTDLIIGADFFLSHRLLVSNSQNQLYFTYSGGPVFDMKVAPQGAAPAAQPTNASPDDPLDAEGYSRRAAGAVGRQDYAAAAADLTSAIALKPDEPRYFYERGMAEMRMLGNPANRPPNPPITDLNRALILKPDYIAALVARAYLHGLRKEPELARADLDAASKAADSQPDERLSIAGGYQAEDMLKPSIDELDRWLEAHPQSERRAEALNNRCWDKGLLGQWLDTALSDCDAALQLSPGNPRFLDSRGLVRFRLGDWAGSITDYNAALRLSPNSMAFYVRGLAKLKKGEGAEGQADLKSATAMQPKIADEAARRGLIP